MLVACDLCSVLNAIAIVGFYGFLLIKLIEYLIRSCSCEKINLEEHSKDGKAWALITGATDGIGKAFSLKLAEKGFNIILVSRTDSKLAQVKDEIEHAYSKVSVKCIKVDFVHDDPDDYRVRVKDGIADLRISVLVNNVGMGPSCVSTYHEITQEQDTAFYKCNILSFSIMSRLILPQMVNRKFGVVVNISSLGAHIEFPGMSVYSGTKAYITKVSNIMAAEYAREGITVLTVDPGYVNTKAARELDLKSFSQLPEFTKGDPDQLASNCLESLGLKKNITGHWFHSVQRFLSYNSLLFQLFLRKEGLAALEDKKNK